MWIFILEWVMHCGMRQCREVLVGMTSLVAGQNGWWWMARWDKVKRYFIVRNISSKYSSNVAKLLSAQRICTAAVDFSILSWVIIIWIIYGAVVSSKLWAVETNNWQNEVMMSIKCCYLQYPWQLDVTESWLSISPVKLCLVYPKGIQSQMHSGVSHALHMQASQSGYTSLEFLYICMNIIVTTLIVLGSISIFIEILWYLTRQYIVLWILLILIFQ